MQRPGQPPKEGRGAPNASDTGTLRLGCWRTLHTISGVLDPRAPQNRGVLSPRAER